MNERRFTVVPSIDGKSKEELKRRTEAIKFANENIRKKNSSEDNILERGVSKRTSAELLKDFVSDIDTIRANFSKGLDITLECEITAEQIIRRIDETNDPNDKGDLANLLDQLENFSNFQEKRVVNG